MAKEKFENFHGQPIWHKSPAIAVLAWTDASCSGHMSLLCCIFGPDLPTFALFAVRVCSKGLLWPSALILPLFMDFLTEAVLPESKINGFFDRGSIA